MSKTGQSQQKQERNPFAGQKHTREQFQPVNGCMLPALERGKKRGRAMPREDRPPPGRGEQGHTEGEEASAQHSSACAAIKHPEERAQAGKLQSRLGVTENGQGGK